MWSPALLHQPCVAIRHTRPGRLERSRNVPVSAAHDRGADSISFHSQLPDIPTPRLPKLLQVQPNSSAAARLRAPILQAPLLRT
jgi:hypothetical protein